MEDLSLLPGPVWLVIDDLHELGCGTTLAQLEQLVQRAPARLRFVLGTRDDLRPGLHRLRLEGELTEIRAADLAFTAAQARALFGAAGVAVPDAAVALLVERTEGWAAGLRLAALSLAGHPDPERFAAGFCGSDRMVAEYLWAEVLGRHREPVRRLLVRTSVLERVNGELADLLTGDEGGEGVLQDLEATGAFVVAVDQRRSWFRYHRLLADLLRRELRRTEPALIPALHAAAARWYAGHGHPAEAIRHAQAAQDRTVAARLLGGPQFLARFPAYSPAGRELTAPRARDTLPAHELALAEPLTLSETRILRYLPTHLTAQEIAGELYVSVSTVKTHMSHLYAKLGSHRRTEAVERARALGLLTAT